MILQMLITCFYFSRGMTSEDLKLRENAPKDLYAHDKTLPEVKKNILLRHMTYLLSFMNNMFKV